MRVAQISDRQTTIASAVEEQTATTNEMSRSVTEAAQGAGQIADDIIGVSGAAESATQALGQTRTAVDELSRMAADLRTTVGRSATDPRHTAAASRPSRTTGRPARAIPRAPQEWSRCRHGDGPGTLTRLPHNDPGRTR
jgi:hypothetical protein